MLDKLASHLENELLTREVRWRIELAEALQQGRLNMTSYKKCLRIMWADHVKLANEVKDKLNTKLGANALEITNE